MRHLPKSDPASAFRHAWVCVGRAEDLPTPGAWLKAPLTPAGVLVVRQEGGEIRAFHAVCTHRAARFIFAEEGHATRFVCPYHNFAFEIDGRACAQTSALADVRLATAGGFIFVTLDAEAGPLEGDLGEMLPSLEVPMPRLERVHRIAYDVEARWDLILDDYQEALRFASEHLEREPLAAERRAAFGTPGPSEARDAMRFPNLVTSLQPDHLRVLTLFPAGESRTRVVCSTYVPRAGSGSPRFEPPPLAIRKNP